MVGPLAAFVGPSGAGKDTLMEAVHARLPNSHLVRRIITRPTEAGGEMFEGVSVTEFERRAAAGAFVLRWGAHGLYYGIPSAVGEVLADGRLALVNLSRGVLAQAAAQFPTLHVLNITASPEVLAARLAGRGRETPEQILKRLSRKPAQFPPGLAVTDIVNEGTVDQAVAQILAALQPARV
ncbi:phosphonate metabolism protein/1,5-bisphosphokinase (PRPP-forming) PhnN [Actibacterium sp. 188UL27-1]|uniref:phosphonate metabolism protein/1,5-bisphosphokinase (PRPP-forming) PhnN n=1 Tax=Actibacterium sp. 188UL27-1 TaxID=2786961 RepID=UPI00195BA464|nr:phosphonate metabolism protein/1,5-bisphosphokinase (PRPP-forming) PhnN [Actibacterium sp. 188UL27-1]MBM7067964.1 phosphonate metabolism protein/1,5-bisphosphokinase (PRPP-forming) PhnN [Actibacterium sp. 188UL27-1]